MSGPAFFPRNFDENKNDLCDNSVIEGNLMQQAPPTFKPKKKIRKKVQKREDQKSTIVFVETSNSHVSTKGIADSGATDHNISTIRPTDEVFEVSTPTYVQTANGVVATKKRVRRFLFCFK